MKVTRGNEKFEPIVITIESEEEAELFWHILNNPFPNVEESAKDVYNIEGLSSNNHQSFWKKFNDVFRPKNIK